MAIVTNKRVREMARELLTLHGLHRWRFTFDRAKTSAGQCDYRRKTISLSVHYINNPKTRIRHIRDTLLHEIAHALTPDHDHDEVWKATAIEIGCTGEQYAEHLPIEERYHVRCPCFANDFKRHHLHKSHRGAVCAQCEFPLVITDRHRHM